MTSKHWKSALLLGVGIGAAVVAGVTILADAVIRLVKAWSP